MPLPIWHKRSVARLEPLVVRFTSSVADDQVLVPYEIECSRCHVRMLRKQGMISKRDQAVLLAGLRRIMDEFSRGRFRMRDEYEDVHMNVEKRLKKICGNAADMLHTARSRNDLIATELKMYVRDRAHLMQKKVISLQRSLIEKAESCPRCIIPGFTHLQGAQPILVPYYLLSYFFKFQRDLKRLSGIMNEMTVSPLGSCAIAGTSLDIDRQYTALHLGFCFASESALDSVGDRDFMCEILFCMAQLMIHISSFCEDIIVLSLPDCGIVTLGDGVTTGSSIMPQKKNPDVCELLRGKSAKAIGSLMAALAVLKGLPGSYNRDLQETKSILFGQVRETLESLDAFRLVVGSTEFQSVSREWQRTPQFICSTDLVEFLVKKGWRFRTAYETVASCVLMAKNDIGVFVQLCAQKTKIPHDVVSRILTPEYSVGTKASYGSTGIRPVRSTLARAKTILLENANSLPSEETNKTIIKK